MTHAYGHSDEQLLELGESLLTCLCPYYLMGAVLLGEVSEGHCNCRVVLHKTTVVACESLKGTYCFLGLRSWKLSHCSGLISLRLDSSTANIMT